MAELSPLERIAVALERLVELIESRNPGITIVAGSDLGTPSPRASTRTFDEQGCADISTVGRFTCIRTSGHSGQHSNGISIWLDNPRASTRTLDEQGCGVIPVNIAMERWPDDGDTWLEKCNNHNRHANTRCSYFMGHHGDHSNGEVSW